MEVIEKIMTMMFCLHIILCLGSTSGHLVKSLINKMQSLLCGNYICSTKCNFLDNLILNWIILSKTCNFHSHIHSVAANSTVGTFGKAMDKMEENQFGVKTFLVLKRNRYTVLTLRFLGR